MMETTTLYIKTQSQQSKLKELTEEALATLCQSLENGKSDEMIRYLEVMSRFPRYSFRNLLLILIQKPDASRVMGYASWKRLGRQVKKDEKAIRIWAPMKTRVGEENRTATDSPKEGNRESEETLIFRPVCVFDVSQTDGKELPKLSDVAGEPGVYLERLKRFASDQGITLGYKDNLRAEGVSRCGEILLRSDLLPALEFHVLSHEIAHELIHKREMRHELSKRQAETEAEAVAYVVSKSIGLHTGNASSDYIQLWNGNKEAVSHSLSAIRRTAALITLALLDA